MKNKMIWVLIAIGVLVIAGYANKAGQKPVVVDLDSVLNENLEKYVEDAAEVKLTLQTTVYSVAAGRVVAVNANVGDVIHKGEVIATMDPQAIMLQIQDLEAQSQGIAAQYREARKPTKQSELDKLYAQLKAAQASYDEAVQTVDNNHELIASGVISAEAYRNSVTDLANKEAVFQAAKSSLASAREGLSSNTRAQYEAQLKEVTSRIELLEKQKQDLKIVSPIEGLLLTKNIEIGNYIQPGQKLFDVGKPESLYLTCDMLVEDIKDVKIGTTVRLSNKDLGIANLMARVSKIHPVAFNKVSDLGINQKRITVEMTLDKPKLGVKVAQLRPGYELTAQFIVASKKNILTVDKKALFDLKGKSTVFVSDKGVAQLRTIEKGIEGEDRVEVLNGLSVGELTVLSPDEKLKVGLKVQKK